MSRISRPGLWGQSARAPLSRRTVLRGFLGGAAVTVGLPVLEVMLPRRAQACDELFPRRFGLFFWGNGNLPDRWTPYGEDEDWVPSEQLAALDAVREWVTVVTGLSVKLPNDSPHSSGAAGILTAAPLTTVGGEETYSAPSIDQVIADAIGGDTIYRSLQTAATNCSGMSWNGPSSRNPPETSPFTFYERLFGASFREPGEKGLVDPTVALRRSVLDGVMGDITTLRGRVSSADRVRLDQHFEGVRELEQRLARLEEDPPNLEACSRPGAPAEDYPDVDGRPQDQARSRAMIDLLAMALACDQTRVFGHYYSDPVSDVLYVGASSGHHELTHNEPSPQEEVNAITTAIVGEFAYLVQAFRAIPEGDGTLLDNCAVLGTSEVSEGRTHSVDEMPILLAGTACGALRTGIHYRSYSQENATRLLLTLLRAMDVDASEFGVDEARVTDGLGAIEG